ncbi:Smr/MutS family protein [Chelativorans sp. AA-79]|nr:Smr/MutS family protein [Chelativorans sp. AA-79]WEX09602.1 Smr/MutS family protein [Chelativorans sp. AA-79]
MKRGGSKTLSAEDRILWSRVARTATPLPGKKHSEEDASSVEKSQRPRIIPSAVAPQAPSVPERQPRTPHPRRLDSPTREKLARGRLDIGGRVDLHGLTQSEAYALLLSFLRQAFLGERRYVLVITGKGSSSGGGVLRNAVPQWFSTPPFSEIVGGYEEAARHHGGGGALYVRLRRKENRR